MFRLDDDFGDSSIELVATCSNSSAATPLSEDKEADGWADEWGGARMSVQAGDRWRVGRPACGGDKVIRHPSWWF